MTLLAEVAHLASGHDYPYRDVFIRVIDELVRLQKIEAAAKNLIELGGGTRIAYKRLEELVK